MIKYRAIKINSQNAPLIAKLVHETYAKFNAAEGRKKAIQKFLDHYDVSARTAAELAEEFKRFPLNFAAFSGQEIVGIIRGRSGRIINLFVHQKFHGRSIGRRLVSSFEAASKKEEARPIKVRSSVYAVPFYSRLGYKKTTGLRSYRGLDVQPMKK